MDTTKNAIEVTNLVKRYKELVALDHFSLTVKAEKSLDCSVQTAPERPQL